MDKLSKRILSLNKNSEKDLCQEININIEALKVDDEVNTNEAVNLSNLDIKDLIKLFENNKKLLKDYFSFGLFKILNTKNLSLIMKKFIVPYINLESVMDHVMELNNNVKFLYILFIVESFRNIFTCK
jgi:hypothetical protein